MYIQSDELLTFTSRGIYCPRANVYIDPWEPVDRAIVTHGHSDHAYAGMQKYLAHPITAAVMRHRIGSHIVVEETEYGQPFSINGVKFSLHPAGHIPGSAQVRVEYRSEVWVFSGDYKIAKDGLSQPFEAVRCNTFITESTFGLPVFRWKEPTKIRDQLSSWIQQNRESGKTSVVFAYSLGKAQRISQLVCDQDVIIVSHGAVRTMSAILRDCGLKIAKDFSHQELDATTMDKSLLVIAPQSAQNSPWLRRFRPYSLASASGWMSIQGIKRRSGVDHGFVISDHADFSELISSISATGAQRVFVTHGYTSQFARYLTEKGYESHEIKTNYGEEVEDTQA